MPHCKNCCARAASGHAAAAPPTSEMKSRRSSASGTTRTARRPTATRRRRDGDRINAVLGAACYNVDRRQLQLIDGWQASEAWRADLRAEYILSEAGGRGRRRCAWVARKIVTNGARTAVQRFLFPKFFPKKFGQKIGAGPPTGNFREWFVCGSGSAPPRPPFVQMKNTRGSFFPPAFRRSSVSPRLDRMSAIHRR